MGTEVGLIQGSSTVLSQKHFEDRTNKNASGYLFKKTIVKFNEVTIILVIKVLTWICPWICFCAGKSSMIGSIDTTSNWLNHGGHGNRASLCNNKEGDWCYCTDM